MVPRRRAASRLRGAGKMVIGAGNVQSEINVTPLVDVCLVLLIIFMVVTPMLQSGIDVQLPETEKPEKYPDSQKQARVAMRLDGTLYIGQNAMPGKEAFFQQMQEMNRSNPDRDIAFKADRRLDYRDVREVMKLINEAGFTKVGLVTTKKE